MFATASGLAELAGGLLLALGFLGPVGPALLLSVMFVAAMTVHRKNGFFVATNGLEHPLIMATAAVGIGLTGPGRCSLDAVLGNYGLLTPTATWLILAIGLLGGIANLAVRRPAAAPRI